jgi:Methylamine utilisation protein MauE
MHFVVEFCRLLIVMIFMVSAFGKSGKGHLRDFTETVAQLTSNRLARPIARSVVAAEFAVVALASAPPTRAAGLLLAAILLVGFAAIAEFAVRTHRPVACHCFGRTDGTTLGRAHVARNTALAGVATAGFFGTVFVAPRAGADLTLTAGLAAFAVAAPLVRWQDIRGLFADTSI